VVLRREPGPAPGESLPENAALLPTTDEVTALGLDLTQAIFLGTLGGEHGFAGTATCSTPSQLPCITRNR
jgi:hypothetical protein